jgi:hypothetical protein
MKQTPYTTPSGLQIGCRYEAPRRVEYLSRDASSLQSALLAHRAPTSWFIKLIWRWL